MESQTNPTPADETTIDPTPLLPSEGGRSSPTRADDRGGRRNSGGGGRRAGFLGAARFLSRASSRRMMREPSMLVRETAAEQLEERQGDWAYSRPVVILDLLWNLAFVAVSIAVLILSRDEEPSMPLRLWIIGYGFQCLLHMVCVCVEYRRRHPQRWLGLEDDEGSGRRVRSGMEEDIAEGGSGYDGEQAGEVDEERTSVAKHLESANTMFSFIWWIIGFYWVSSGGQYLPRDAPQLYWLCIIFLAFDVFFVVFCVALACIIGIAVCCCLPCIIAILYAVADQIGASEEDIQQLPKYKFRRFNSFDKLSGEISGPSGGIMTECGAETPREHALSPEDAECCICLCAYDDGAELHELPCNHHFHCSCIDKWLYINATCPLCKYNIIKSGNNHGTEDV